MRNPPTKITRALLFAAGLCFGMLSNSSCFAQGSSVEKTEPGGAAAEQAPQTGKTPQPAQASDKQSSEAASQKGASDKKPEAAPDTQTRGDGVYPPCEGKPDEDAMAAAKGAFQAGNAAFNEADYERAITYWEDAYRRDCTAHAMLKNLARAYELNGDYTKAILALRTYSQRRPNSGEDAAMERRIDNLKRKLEKERAQKQALARQQQQREGGHPQNRSNLGGNAAYDQDDFASDEHSGGRSVVPLVVAGIGAGLGVLGAVQWKRAADDEDAAAQLCPERMNCPPDVAKAGTDAQNRMALWGYGFGAGGAAIAIGGLIWYFAQEPEPEQSARLTPLVSPGFAGLSYGGQF